MKKLDFINTTPIIRPMQKTINTEALQNALDEHGLTQSQLAKAVGVSSQAVTNWKKGKDFPRPATLLKLATTLRLTFEQLVQTIDPGKPVVAFRKKGGAKTTDIHVSNAEGVGRLLKPLVPYLPEMQALRTLITSPSTEYNKLQLAVSQTRDRLGIGEQAELEYTYLINEFNDSGAVLVPVMWGAKQRHENALHIRLPEEDVTFIFLNLDTRIEDFKFWMAHELAHVYTPELAGTEQGEDFADAFAGALLFPKASAEAAYRDALNVNGVDSAILNVLQHYSYEYLISLNTVYQQIKQYAKANKLPPITIDERKVHQARNSNQGKLVTKILFDPAPPAPDHYIATSERIFQSNFFRALRRMIHEEETGSSYLQQILDLSIHDARALDKVLRH